MAAKKTFDAIPRNEAEQEKWACEISPRPDLYSIMDELIGAHHEELEGVTIALCWRYGWKPDDDGNLVLGKFVKCNPQDVVLHGVQARILLNHEAWTSVDFSDQEKRILIDHELCHGALKLDDEGCAQVDINTGRLKIRTRRHDHEEFFAIGERYGITCRSIERYAASLMRGVKANNQMALFETMTSVRPNIQLVKPGVAPRTTHLPVAPIDLPDLVDLLDRAQPERGWTMAAAVPFTAQERLSVAAWARNHQDSPPPPEVTRHILEDLQPFDRQADLEELMSWVDISPASSGEWAGEDLVAAVEWATAACRFDRGESVHVPILPLVLAPDFEDVHAIVSRFLQAETAGLSRDWLTEHMGARFPSVGYVFDALKLSGNLVNVRNGHYRLAEDIDDAVADAIVEIVMRLSQRRPWQGEQSEPSGGSYVAAGAD